MQYAFEPWSEVNKERSQGRCSDRLLLNVCLKKNVDRLKKSESLQMLC